MRVLQAAGVGRGYSFGGSLTSVVESDMLWVEMHDGEEHRAPEEILEELEALRELDADDVLAEAIFGQSVAEGKRTDATARTGPLERN